MTGQDLREMFCTVRSGSIRAELINLPMSRRFHSPRDLDNNSANTFRQRANEFDNGLSSHFTSPPLQMFNRQRSGKIRAVTLTPPPSYSITIDASNKGVHL